MTRNPDVLLIGINYSPEITGIAPYTTGVAEFLARQSYAVSVLTGFPHYPDWTLDPRYRWTNKRRESLNGVDLVRMRHFVPRRMTVTRRALYEMTFFFQVLLEGVRWRPKVMVAVSPALAAIVAAALLSSLRNVPFVAYVQDLMGSAAEQSGMQGGGRAGRAVRWLEGLAMRRASDVVVVSPAFLDQVTRYGIDREQVHLMKNWTHIAPSDRTRDSARQELGWPVSKFLAVHTGNIGFKQNLENLVDAARLLIAEDSAEIVIIGDGNQRDHLLAYASDTSHVSILPSVDSSTYPLILAAADVLILNERPTVEEMSLPSKLTSYLASGRPILAAVSKNGATANELRQTGAAVTVSAGHPSELVAALRRLRDSPTTRADLAVAGAEYSRRNLSPDGALQSWEALITDVGSVSGRHPCSSVRTWLRGIAS